MKHSTLKIVITGAPNSGKSTTIQKLRERGFRVVDEVAREIIAEGKLSPAVDLDAFNAEVLVRQKAQEDKPHGEIVFMDRGRYDALAYYDVGARPLPNFLKSMEPELYQLAFILDVVPTWNADGVRHENIDFAKLIDPLFASNYARMRVNTIRVPLMKPEERVTFILAKVKALFPHIDLSRYKVDGRVRKPSEEKMAITGIAEELEYSLALLSNIGPAVCVFGSNNAETTSHEYRSARRLSGRFGKQKIAVITSGGRGITEAANRGCAEAGGISVGINVSFPVEAPPNSYSNVTINVGTLTCRNEVFRRIADGYIVYPGGFGTLSEFEDVVRLIQTGCMHKRPVVLVGKTFWNGFMRFLEKNVLPKGYIKAADLKLFTIVATEQEAFDLINAQLSKAA